MELDMKKFRGIIIFLVLVGLFVFYSIRNSKRDQALQKDIIKTVTYVTDGKVNPDNEGKLVLVTGKISFDKAAELLKDEPFINSFKIERTVKDFVSYKGDDGKTHYEWKERESYVSDGADPIDAVYTQTLTVNPYIGEFYLDDTGLKKVPTNDSYNEGTLFGSLKYNGMEFTNSGDEEEPGDVSITYDYYNTSKNDYLTVLAKQSGKSFKPYSFDKEEVYSVYEGKIDSEEKLTAQFGEQTKRSNRGKIAFIIIIVVVGGLLVVNSIKNKKEEK